MKNVTLRPMWMTSHKVTRTLLMVVLMAHLLAPFVQGAVCPYCLDIAYMGANDPSYSDFTHPSPSFPGNNANHSSIPGSQKSGADLCDISADEMGLSNSREERPFFNATIIVPEAEMSAPPGATHSFYRPPKQV